MDESKYRYKYSIIVPYYNVEDYIDECIQSLLGQCGSYEIILVDDASEDQSRITAEKYEAEYEYVKLVKSEVNRGLGGARNLGLDCAMGEWILFVDSDDLVAGHFLQKIDRAIEGMGEREVLIFNFSVYTEKETKELAVIPVLPKEEFEKKRFISYSVTACGKVFHHTLFQDGRIRFPEKRYHEDNAVYWKWMIKTDKIRVLQAPLYRYRQRSGSITKSRDPRKKYDMVYNIEETCAFLKEKQCFEKYYEEIEFYAVRSVVLELCEDLVMIDRHSEYLNKAVSYIRENFPNSKKNRYLKEMAGRGDRLAYGCLIHRRFYMAYLLLKLREIRQKRMK